LFFIKVDKTKTEFHGKIKKFKGSERFEVNCYARVFNGSANL